MGQIFLIAALALIAVPSLVFLGFSQPFLFVVELILMAFLMKPLRQSFLGRKAFWSWKFTAALVAFVGLFYVRLCGAIFDTGCPTYLLNMVAQAKGGHIPVSYAEVPEVPANFHQVFAVTAGLLARAFQLDPYPAMMWLAFCGFVLFTAVLLISFKDLKQKSIGVAIVATALVLFSSSFPTLSLLRDPLHFQNGWYEYLSVLEYFTAHSWPLSLMSLIFLFWICAETNFSFQICAGFFLVFFLGAINPSIFVFALAGLTAFLLLSVFRDHRPKKNIFWILFLAYFIFRVQVLIPSVFLQGRAYRFPESHLRHWFESGEFFLDYFRLIGPLPYLVLIPLLTRFKKFDFRIEHMIFGAAFLYPLLIELEIENWDQIHKTMLVLQVSGVFVLVSAGKKYWTTACVLVAAISLLPQVNMYSLRTAFVPPKIIQDSERPLIDYLSGKDLKYVWLYDTQTLDQCGSMMVHTSNLSGVPFSGAYFRYFFLSPEWSARAKARLTWSERPEDFKRVTEGLGVDEAILLSKSREIEFVRQAGSLERFTVVDFGDYEILHGKLPQSQTRNEF